MTSSQAVATAGPPMLQSIPNDTASSSYLVDLASELPLAASQFGLALTTALEYRESPESVGSKRPSDIPDAKSGPIQPHYRSRLLPTGKVDGEEGALTEMDVTIDQFAITIYARCEATLMRAAALEAEDSGSSGRTQPSPKYIASVATAENLSKALERNPVDPVVQGHYQNVLSVITDLLEHQSAKRTRSGKGELGFEGNPQSNTIIG